MVETVRMTLDHWLTSRKISAEEFGKTLGCSGQAVRYWRTGSRMPDADMAAKIVAATGGEVTVSCLHETRLAFLNSRAADSSAATPTEAA